MTTLPSDIELATRVRGLFLGAAAGDALGWPQEQRSGIRGGDRARSVTPAMEFRTWLRWAGSEGTRYEDPVAAGEYSDDTQLLLATARACLRGTEWLSWFTSIELPVWPIYQRGGGRAVLRACRSWQRAIAPWKGPKREVNAYFDAGANGAAMRIAPHVVVTLRDSSSNLLVERVLQDSVQTHGHPRALVGAVVHALAIRFMLQHGSALEYGDLVSWLLSTDDLGSPDRLSKCLPDFWVEEFSASNGSSFSVAWTECIDEMNGLLRVAMQSLSRGALADDEKTLRDLGCFDPDRNGAGTVTAAAACYLASRYAANPSMGLLGSAFQVNADTDTLGSMTASLLGALHGSEWITPLLGRLQDQKYLEFIADELLTRDFGTANSGRGQTAPSLGDWLGSLVEGGKPQIFADGRPLEKFTSSMLVTRSPNQVARFKFMTTDGQSMYIDRTIREVSKRSPQTSADSSGGQPARAADQERPHVARVAIKVRSLSATRHFYSEVLGIRVVEARPALLVNSLAFLEESEPEAYKGAVAQIRIHVPDLEEARSLLLKYSIQIRSEETLERTHSVSILDPDGNEVLLWMRR